MTSNSLSIHSEYGDIFYQNFNTGENFYHFILAGQNDQTASVPKRISYHHGFENYTQTFLPSFSIENVEKFDIHILIKMQNICSIDLMTTLKRLAEKEK